MLSTPPGSVLLCHSALSDQSPQKNTQLSTITAQQRHFVPLLPVLLPATSMDFITRIRSRIRAGRYFLNLIHSK